MNQFLEMINKNNECILTIVTGKMYCQQEIEINNYYEEQDKVELRCNNGNVLLEGTPVAVGMDEFYFVDETSKYYFAF